MKKSIALVLSSGGARGIAHIGAIEELERQGYQITSIAGSSMGALVGGIYATGQLSIFKEWLCTLDKKGVFDLIDFTVSSDGVIKGNRIIKEMKKMIPDRNIEELSIPFCAVATDIINNKEIIFTQGKLYDAIRASISIPTVFTPFKFEGKQLVDGGILNPIPVNRVKRNTSDILVVVDVNAPIPFEKVAHHTDSKPEIHKYFKYFNSVQQKLSNLIPKNKTDHIGYFNLINKSLGLMLQHISALSLEKYPPDILINISHDSFGTFDFYKASEIIKTGELAVQKSLS